MWKPRSHHQDKSERRLQAATRHLLPVSDLQDGALASHANGNHVSNDLTLAGHGMVPIDAFVEKELEDVLEGKRRAKLSQVTQRHWHQRLLNTPFWFPCG